MVLTTSMQPQFARGLVHSRSSLYRWSSHAVGVGGTLLMHALLFQAATLGASGPKSRAPEETGPGASAITSGVDLSMTLVLVQLPGVTHSNTLQALASSGVAPVNGPIQMISPDPTPAFDVQDESDDESAEASQTVGDTATQSLLFGRYTGQINARIERAWRKPRSAVTDETAVPSLATLNDKASDAEEDDLFRCAVRITQDIRGNVKETELVRCNGTLVWQQSLVNAIQQASPLPAPPSPTVFTNALTLSFESRAYVLGMAEDDYYEPATYRLVQVNPSVPPTYHAGSQTMNSSFDAADVPPDPGLPFNAPVAPRTEADF